MTKMAMIECFNCGEEYDEDAENATLFVRTSIQTVVNVDENDAETHETLEKLIEELRLCPSCMTGNGREFDDWPWNCVSSKVILTKGSTKSTTDA